MSLGEIQLLMALSPTRWAFQVQLPMSLYVGRVLDRNFQSRSKVSISGLKFLGALEVFILDLGARNFQSKLRARIFLILGPSGKTHMMPALRCSSGTTGEIASVLSSTTLPLPQVTQQFADRVLVLRVAESDAFSGNMRAERLLQQSRGHELVHMTCLAHKTHGAAQRTFELAPQTLRGVVRTGWIMRQAGDLGQFRSWLRGFIQQRAHLSHTAAPMDASSKNYRAYLVQFFRPRSARKKVTTDIIFTLLNGDLRDPEILCHHCPGRHCCLNKGHLIEKLTFWGNWLHWQDGLAWVALWTGTHSILPSFFHHISKKHPDWSAAADIDHAGQKLPDTAPMTDVGDVDDKVIALRKEQREPWANARSTLSRPLVVWWLGDFMVKFCWPPQNHSCRVLRLQVHKTQCLGLCLAQDRGTAMLLL